MEPHTSPLPETHFSLHFLPCIYGQLSVPFKRGMSFLFSAKVWACLAVVRAEASNDWDGKSKFLELLNYSAAQSSYTSTRNTPSIKYIKILNVLVFH